MPPEIIPVTRYTRQDVLRILRLNPRQLVAWERAGLVATSSEYSFENLVQLRKLRDLRATRISAKSILASVGAMQRVSGMVNPLLEAGLVQRGSRMAFRHSGSLMEPVTQQLIFDFDFTPSAEMSVVGKTPERVPTKSDIQAQAQEMFLRAVQLEENPATLREAAALYEQILELHPGHAPACINLGTINYNQRLFRKAEEFYRRATVADPEYALAFFDLGNVLDELQRLNDAIGAYQTAIRLVPQYADAHYNLALAYERKGEKRRALRHWLMYVRLDPVGPWAGHAKAQAKKIMSQEQLRIVTRHGRVMQHHVAAG